MFSHLLLLIFASLLQTNHRGDLHDSHHGNDARIEAWGLEKNKSCHSPSLCNNADLCENLPTK